jgi:hypothetical protein
LFLFAGSGLNAQTFTKVTNSVIASDGQASRSVNFIDMDNDNDLDLFISTGKTGGDNNLLYRNNNGVFEKITNSPVALDSLPSDGSSWGDFDNDGDPDLCVVNWYGQNDLLYRNDGNFNFVFLSASPVSTSGGYSETCSWGDYDNDGWLDLVITNSGNNANPNGREFLFKNNGNGTFTKIDTGIIVTDGKFTRGCNWVDADNDGDLDLFACSERGQNESLFINHGAGYFTALTGSPLVTSASETFSSSWADYDNDGDFDVVLGNHNNQKNFLFRNDGGLNFVKIDTGAVTAQNFATCTGFADYDNDGDLDLFVSNGYQNNGQPIANLLFKNMLIESGTAYFEKITAGELVEDTGDTYGFAWGDYDKDGDLDIAIAKTRNEAENDMLYRNDNANGNKWIDIKTTGVQSNRSGIGAKVKVKAVINGNPVWQMQQVEGLNGQTAQTLNLHFGLGNAAVIDSIKIIWPSGTTDVYTNVQPNNFYKATEGQTFILGVNTISTEAPDKYSLHQNYPNPFNPATLIRYELAEKSAVKLQVIDNTGKQVALLVDGNNAAGVYEVSFNGANLASGIYFYKLTTEKFSETKKMILLK